MTASESQKPHRGIYLLPSLFTIGALFAGFYAIIAALRGEFSFAAIAILVSMVLDGLDGRVARMTGTQSDFGAELDSLSDMVSFGIAPALIVYEWSLKNLGDVAVSWGKLGWLAAFVYAACTALRLARFNTQIGKTDKRFFQGLASPSAAVVMVSLVWFSRELGISGQQLMILAFAVTLALGALMVTRIPYYSFKAVGSDRRMPFVAVVAVVALLAVTSIDPPTVIFIGFTLYALSGPAWWLYRRGRRLGRRSTSGAAAAADATAAAPDPDHHAGDGPADPPDHS